MKSGYGVGSGVMEDLTEGVLCEVSSLEDERGFVFPPPLRGV